MVSGGEPMMTKETNHFNEMDYIEKAEIVNL